MSIEMKKMIKTAGITLTGVMGAALIVSASANAQSITSVNDLLQKVRANSAKTASENAAREAEFRKRRDTQGAKLAQAQAELDKLERQARKIQSTFDANKSQIQSMKDDLKSRQGEFSEVFGLARKKAGEFKATLESSIINSQYPGRTEVLAKISESDALPSTDQLNSIWKTMLSEIKYQRQVATFDAPVANTGTDSAATSVTRVGPFSIFTKAEGKYLEYKAPTKEGDIALTYLAKQPPKAIASAAKKVINAGPDQVVFGPVDPTKGSLLKALEDVPGPWERFLQGGIIGWIIMAGVFAIGALIGIFKIFQLLGISAAVKSQKKRAQASGKNPLGRIMQTYEGVKDRDEELIELKLDETILRESPKLEWGLNFIKLGAGIAPLLGLLGTVVGMIQTFQAMMVFGVGDPQLMAGGISKALVTTMLGLIAAIPLLILHSFCSSLARGIQSTLEEQSAGIVARHVENRRG
ncbi:MAG: MotA/TolQ/ExbB proton channel family protein [Robiginitomaculum sp.]